MAQVDLVIDAMHCDGCVRRVRTSLEHASGVQIEALGIGHARLNVASDATLNAVVAALEKAGYPARRSPAV